MIYDFVFIIINNDFCFWFGIMYIRISLSYEKFFMKLLFNILM